MGFASEARGVATGGSDQKRGLRGNEIWAPGLSINPAPSRHFRGATASVDSMLWSVEDAEHGQRVESLAEVIKDVPAVYGQVVTPSGVL